MKLLNKSSTAYKYRLCNTKKEPLTAEKLITFSGCEHYSPEESVKVVESINQLVLVFIDYHRNKSTCIDNQHFVDLVKEQELEKIFPVKSKNKAA
jgi:predicted SnoaL-like aldol condensation-catalyzing enzyme